MPTLTAADIALPVLESPQDPAAWTALLDALRRAIPCDLAALMHAGGTADAPTLTILARTDASLDTDYAAHYRTLDPYVSARAQARYLDSDDPLFTEEVVPETEVLDGPFYNEFLRPRGDLFHGLATIRPLQDGSRLHFGLMRRRGWRFDEHERRLGGEVVRLARPALLQRQLLRRLELDRAAGFGLADNCGDALLVLDRDARLIHGNAAARALAARNTVLTLRDDALALRAADDQRWLRRECAALASSCGSAQDRVRMRRLAIAGTGHWILAVLTRLPTVDPLSGQAPAAQVALYLRDPSTAIPRIPADALIEVFALTPREATILDGLLHGVTVERMAQAWGIRSDTVRGHVKSLLAKTGCSRQQDLVQLVTKALPHLAPLRSPDAV